MAEDATPDVEQLMSDYADLHDGDHSNLHVVSESFTLHGPGLPEEGLQGREAYGDYLQSFQDGFSDLELAINDFLVSDDIAMAEFTITGTHDGEFNGIPPTNRSIEMKTMAKMEISDGKIQEEWDYFDPQSMMTQLGITDE